MYPYYENRGPGLAAACIVMIIVCSLAVALRVWSRAIARDQKFGWDDWFALASLPPNLGLLACFIFWTYRGLGTHSLGVPVTYQFLENIFLGQRLLWAGGFLYDFGVGLPRYSALLFYGRIFQASANFKYCLWAAAGANTIWLIVQVFSDIFSCTPIRKAWNFLLPGTCLNTFHWYQGTAAASVAIDGFILLLPMPMLLRLQAKPSKKIWVMFVFFCGYCVIAISIGRLVAATQAGPDIFKDLTWNPVTYMYWVICEGPISLFGVCLPGIFKFVKRGFVHGPSSLFTTRTLSQSDATPRNTSQYALPGRLRRPEKTYSQIWGGKEPDDMQELECFSNGGPRKDTKSSHVFVNHEVDSKV